jgi:6-pyruvoyltetrahydropterin/6-carboxytetrahydropterin synthase
MNEDNMTYPTTIELFKEDMKFSAGHYTIFSATHREKLHGHNFRVFAAITAHTDENGMAFDYGIYKRHLRDLCKKLNSCFLIAGDSTYQTIEYAQDYIYIHFNHEKIPFLASDVLILPLKNITVEELARWFVAQLIADTDNLQRYQIQSIDIKVFSGPGQSGSFCWVR